MRIFWLGMHKVLVHTELPRLRQLGFEVFVPPYLSSVQDQSAHHSWDKDQPTTLPREIFEKLSQYNFFFNEISQEMGEILNLYFDAVIVTIAVPWLVSILKVYHKKVIYRCYGQSFLLSPYLWNLDLFRLITERDNFWFVPHAQEAIDDEHQWLKERTRIVPYTTADEVFARKNTWSLEKVSRQEIAMLCPNIDNLYYRKHFHFLKKNFSDPHYRFYGVQLRNFKDPQIVGTLPREEYLSRFAASSGYLYSYTDGNVCYLPPIEMMILGGPVLFLAGSLLDRLFQDRHAPGRAKTIPEAHEKSRRLLSQDKAFIQDVISSQQHILQQYAPSHVWSIFDTVFQEILNPKVCNKAPHITFQPTQKAEKSRIYLLHHFPENCVHFNQGRYAATEGIPRVMRLMVHALLEKTDHEIVITCRRDQLVNFYGFFSSPQHLGRVRLLPLDQSKGIEERLHLLKAKLSPEFKTFLRKIAIFSKAYLISGYLGSRMKIFLSLFKRLKSSAPSFLYQAYQRLQPQRQETCPSYITEINQDAHCHAVLVPHYYLFPEAQFLEKKIALYLPDYIPHFFPEEFEKEISLAQRIGKKIVEKAHCVMTNSHFTKSYLPATALQVQKDKITTFYLPPLMLPGSKSSVIELENTRFLFYPTQARPHKNLSFLLEVFHTLLQEQPDLKLVLTCYLYADSKALATYKRLKLQGYVLFYPKVSNETLSFLYSKAACLCFTSLIEGNFPPQILEALHHETPIVTTKLPLITEILKENSNLLLLCEPGDLKSFVSNTLYALEQKETVLTSQAEALKIVESQSDWKQFSNSLADCLKSL